jgi:hypothetical protein
MPSSSLRINPSDYSSRPWRLHEVVPPDFRVEDVWRLPGEGGAADVDRLIDRLCSYDPSASTSVVLRILFGARERLGRVFGWDDERTTETLADRVPADLRESCGVDLAPLPFRQLFRTEEEWAAEAANRTVHGVLHVGRVPAGDDRYHAHLTVLVKPNGLLGQAYMACIKPFRYLLVYPRLLGTELGWPRDDDGHEHTGVATPRDEGAAALEARRVPVSAEDQTTHAPRSS